MTALTFLEQGFTRRNRRRSFATLFLLLFLIYFLLPLFWLIVSSTKSDPQLFSTFGLWFAHFNLVQNLREVFTYDGGIYLTWLGNTALYAISAGVGAALFATMAGYAFAKYRFRGRGVLFAVVLGSIMIPQTALVIPLYLLLSKVGIINTPFAVILPSLISPVGVFLMRVYAERAVPDALLDAAAWTGPASSGSSGASPFASSSRASPRCSCSRSSRPGTTTSCRSSYSRRRSTTR